MKRQSTPGPRHSFATSSITLKPRKRPPQHQIMALHGHANPATSEIYTRAANRWEMTREAAKILEKSAMAIAPQ